ncbi:MAG: class I SAM-dependent methyltransferase [Terriglobales bacterium]
MSKLSVMSDDNAQLKGRIKEHWEGEVCGSRYGSDYEGDRRRYFDEIERTRYEQDYMLRDFAKFETARGKKVLEVGLGTGTDFIQWARNGAEAYGRDLTQASVKLVTERLSLEGLHADVAQGDAEALQFPDNFFDVFYSWGVLMATPNTEKAIAEAHRVLKPGGSFKIMLYHSRAVATFLVWMVTGPMRFRWISPRAAYFENVESPGMKVYSVEEARAMVGRYFTNHPIRIETVLGSGDLLTHKFSQKYQGKKWEFARAVFPRWFVRHVLGHGFGTVMMIETVK